MKHYDTIPENFLMIRFVVTRFCNYNCPYCFVSKRERKKRTTMFDHYSKEKWLQSLSKTFSNKILSFHITGGEPLIIKDAVLMVEELMKWKNVERIRIDSNISTLSFFLKHVKSEKVRFNTSFHPTQVSLSDYLPKVKKLHDLNMIGFVNFVASSENLKTISPLSPHKLAEIFKNEGIFLNIAKDYRCKGFGYRYDKVYDEYINLFQHPLDRAYKSDIALHKHFPCGGGKHYIFFDAYGKVTACGKKEYQKIGLGNIFKETVKLPTNLCECEEDICSCITSYSFSSSNNFDPTQHMKDYVDRCKEIRDRLNQRTLDKLWKKVNIDKIWTPKNIMSPIKKKIYSTYRGGN